MVVTTYGCINWEITWQVHTGKGIANRALKLLLEKVTDKDITQVKAKLLT